jgi:hypothetical protein
MKWQKREVTESAKRSTDKFYSVNGVIGRRGGMSVRNTKIAMEKYQLVISECEMDAEIHEIGAAEMKLRSML